MSCDDKEGHYIVTPDDIIYKRCKFLLSSAVFFRPSSLSHPAVQIVLFVYSAKEHLVKWLKQWTSRPISVLLSRSSGPSKSTVRPAASKFGYYKSSKNETPLIDSACAFRSRALSTPIDVSFYSKCIHLLNWFDYRNHICLVSELLGMCVYDFLKENDFAPFPRDHIQSFARQLLGSVACMCFTHPNVNSFV